MNCVIIQSPLVQLNTPYPSGAYLQSFFKQQEFIKFESVRWLDFSNELFHSVFSKYGLQKIFEGTKNEALKLADEAQSEGNENAAFNLRRYVLQKENWIEWIEKIKAILCDGNGSQNLSGREFCHEFVFSPFSPRGERMENYLASLANSREISVDDARFLATLALADLADYITAVYDKNFSLIRYAEHLATSEKSFESFERVLDSPVLKDFLEPLTFCLLKKICGNQAVQKANETTLFCISIPFAGCFASALSMCRTIKKLYGNKAIICIGGGYINTELRGIAEESIFNYADFISYDRGYGSYIDIMQNGFMRDGRAYYKTAYCFDDRIIPPLRENSKCVSLQEKEDEFTRTVFPDYDGMNFSRYPRLCDDVNPMHRIWSDGSWLKAYLAHGCYWHKCAFCDTTLDYVCAYKRLDSKKLYVHLASQAKKTGIYGIHFVDEACPPQSLIEFGMENCKTLCRTETAARLNFWGNIRFEKSYTRDVADFLSYSGLTAVSGGIEIATESGLNKVNKGTDFESIVASLCALKEAGILVHAYMIYGYYSETAQDLIDSMEVLRQLFSAGLLDSSFWHKFVLTKHSTLYKEYLEGKHQDLKPIFPHGSKITYAMPPKKNSALPDASDGTVNSAWFAQNTIHFEGEEKSEKFSDGLNLALDCWMHGKNLEKNVQSFFDFKVPHPTLGKDYVQKAIEKYEQKKNASYNDYEEFCKSTKNYYWIAGNVEANGKSLMWQYFGQIFSFCFESEQNALNAAEFLNSLSVQKKAAAPQKFSEQTCFISKKLYRKLRGNGLIALKY